ncbi:MAG: hypothetical protein ACXWL5_00760 [Candidatus Chromulinivorax sp.]
MKFILLIALIFTTTCYPSNLREAIVSLSPDKQSAEIETGWTDNEKKSLASIRVNIKDRPFLSNPNCDPQLIESFLRTLDNDYMTMLESGLRISNFCSSIKKQLDDKSEFEFLLIAEDSYDKGFAKRPHIDWCGQKEKGYRIFLPLVGPATIIAKDMLAEQQAVCEKIFYENFESHTFSSKKDTDYPITWQPIPQGTAIIGGIGGLGNSLFHKRPETDEARLFALITFTKLKKTEN